MALCISSQEPREYSSSNTSRIRCCNYIPGVPSFRLICIKPQLKHFHFWRSFRSLEVIKRSLEVNRRSNTGFVAATVFPGFLAFIKPGLLLLGHVSFHKKCRDPFSFAILTFIEYKQTDNLTHEVYTKIYNIELDQDLKALSFQQSKLSRIFLFKLVYFLK